VLAVIRGTDLRRSMSAYLVRRIEKTPNVELVTRTRVARCEGGAALAAVELEDLETHALRRIETPALFSFIGAAPRTRWLPPAIERDEKGFIKTGGSVLPSSYWPLRDREPLAMETNRPGVFAAGDVRSGSTKRCATAVGEGGQAIECIHAFLGTYV
jgi:thioredoxin reductase (NADPH)